MAKQLICVAAGALEWGEYEEPELEPRQVRIRAEFGAAKHGTEMAGFKGYGMHRGAYDRDWGLLRESRPHGYPTMVGNMVVGRVIEVGADVQSFQAGERALTYSGFRETCVAAEGRGGEGRLWKVPEGLSWKSAVCLDPADFACGAIRDGNVRVGDAVAIFGMGAISLMAVQLVKLAGASPIIAVDPLPNRREAATQCGADLALDPAACDVGLEIRRATGKRGADVVIEYSGARGALQHALRGAAYGGTVVAGAYPGPYDAGLDLGAEAHVNTLNLVFTRACSEPLRDYPRWTEQRIYDTCWRLICEGKLDGERIVTPVVRFADLLDEYPKIATAPETNVKLGCEYE